MFTGLVEGLGTILEFCEKGEISRLSLAVGPLAEGVHPGDSIALNGCCLTATEIEGENIRFDLLQETLARTNLGGLGRGSSINIERALPAQGRYGGHFVTGHIDATGVIRRWERVGQDFELRIGIHPAQGAYLVPKGCIAVDGISLTVAEVLPDEFSVWIIPHTRAVTALRERAVGDLVNLEFDLLAKYTEKILVTRGLAVSGTASPPAAGEKARGDRPVI
jgi:riboflavin synthase